MQYMINLLKDSEQRYEGPVSTRFLVFAGAGFVMVAVSLLIAYVIFLGLVLHANLERSRQTWRNMEPRYNELTELENSFQLASRMEEELRGWERSRTEWHRILLHIQREIPSSIQLVKLEGRDRIEKPAQPQKGESMPDPVSRLQLFLTGRVTGPAGEEEVTRFIRSLLEPTDEQAPSFRTASLVSIQRDRRETTQIVNLFDLDIAGYPRDIQ